MGVETADEMDLVSVVIPAFNAAETIGDTLDSVRRQTHRNLEIVVVDDGSTDSTREIAERHASEDPRIGIISIPNSGVAEARNAGIDATRGRLIAPLDADDLWHPEKLARQLDVLNRGGPSMGFVYTGFRRIDVCNRVMGGGFLEVCEGWVFLHSVFSNFVGNGSSLLIRREALEQIGGYSSELRDHGVEGAEDRLVQILISRQWTVGAVPACLTGYRQRPDAMSKNQPRMLRSQLMIYDIVERRHPEIPAWILNAARSCFEVRLAMRLAIKLKLRAAAAALLRATLHSPRSTLIEVKVQLPIYTRRAWQKCAKLVNNMPVLRTAPGPSFYEVDPDTDISQKRYDHFHDLIERVAGEEHILRCC